ncbi:uncharacterized protein PgNI_03301 [Pyricularia grisea]|uniref:Uncharacterized protein n=1 Tax=Pyricularia grisea TaxID=148305 RepID=A0A6P8BDE4_PYRGI|nr:uncharacterized protein PgNI_03301 [Pyricularia grisea]TLD13784.1 hypothetical protein PgNI_03301 [Pyricularia grisea]
MEIVQVSLESGRWASLDWRKRSDEENWKGGWMKEHRTGVA